MYPLSFGRAWGSHEQVGVSRAWFVPHSFKQPKVAISPTTLECKPHFANEFFLAFNQTCNASSCGSKYSSGVSNSFVEGTPGSSDIIKSAIYASDAGHQFSDLQCGSCHFGIHAGALGYLAHSSSGLYMTECSSIGKGGPVFFSSARITIFNHGIHQVGFSDRSHMAISLSSTTSARISVASAGSFGFAHFTGDTSHSSPNIFKVLVSFFFPRHLQSARVPSNAHAHGSQRA